ncbi:MAG TPA: branched-chain amino acid aminotransferase [Chitinophagales bacterium]|nr:branched-chain amino acid aminotransferase [Chitinophagales bacterium]
MGYKITIEKARKSRVSEVDFNNLPFGKHFSDHMFIAEYEDGEWKNARIVPFGPFEIHPALSSLHYGQSIFEGMKAEKDADGNPIIFRPLKNLNRFNISADRMAMPEVPEDLFMQAVEKLVVLDRQWIPDTPNSSLYIRPYMFAAEEYMGIKPAERFKFMIFTGPVGAYYSKPVKVFIHDKYVRAFPGGVGYAKCAGNYGAVMMPTREIRKMGYDQILWLDGIHHRYLQEIGTMNIFVVIDGVLITPSLDQGTILDGITRDSILRLAENEGYVIQERDIAIDELINAYHEGKLEDMFGSGTAAVLSHIGEFHYKGETYELPSEEEREISNKLKARLTSIKSGKAEDIFEWLHTVPVDVYAHL